MSENLKMRLSEAEARVADAEQSLTLLGRLTQEKQAELKARIMDYVLASKAVEFKAEELEAFLKQPYVLLPKDEAEWFLILPRFIDVQVGWLERQTETYNVFIVNRQIAWLSDIPDFLREELDLKEPFKVAVEEDMLVADQQHLDEIWNRYKNHFVRREGAGKIRIRLGHHFQLLASLIRDGILPFNPKPVNLADKKRTMIHEAITNSPQRALVISRVGDEGVSLAKVERIIEFDFLFGSRRQEMQRLGRLFHSDYEGEHVILMTQDEYARYKKRLYAIYEKGFEIKVHT